MLNKIVPLTLLISILLITTTVTRAASQKPCNEIGGERGSDYVVYNPTTATWMTSYADFGPNQKLASIQFGYPGVVPVPGDYDGDDLMDIAVYDPQTAIWHQFSPLTGYSATAFGFPGVIPVPKDYDGDGRTDIGVWDPQTGMWYIFKSTDGFSATQFGYKGTIPVPADYDGDGKCDLAVWEPIYKVWYIWQSTEGFRLDWSNQISPTNTTDTITTDDAEDYIPVPGDYDNDGRADIATYAMHSGQWLIQQSGDNNLIIYQWGYPGAIPTPAQFSTTSRTEIGVYAPAESADDTADWRFKSWNTLRGSMDVGMPIHDPAYPGITFPPPSPGTRPVGYLPVMFDGLLDVDNDPVTGLKPPPPPP